MIQRFQSQSMPFVSGDFLYFQGVDDRVWKVDINTGNADDNFNLNGVWKSKSTPFVAGDYVYFQNADNTLIKSLLTAGWMEKISDDRMLSELNIPGSHDSAALYDYLVKSSPVYKYNAKDQFDGLAEQLNYGIRFFDIRLRVDNGRLEAWHGVQQPSQDQKISFDDIVILCKDFLSQFRNECIVMSIKKEGGDAEIGEMVNARIQQDSAAANYHTRSSLWYTDAFIPKLGDVRGKIVLIRRFNLSYPLGIDATSWQDNSADFSISAPNGTFRVQDFYGPPGDKNGSQANKWNAVKNMGIAAQQPNHVRRYDKGRQSLFMQGRFSSAPQHLRTVYWLSVHNKDEIEIKEVEGAERFGAYGALSYNSHIAVLRFGETSSVEVLPGLAQMHIWEDAAVRLGLNLAGLASHPLRRRKTAVAAPGGTAGLPPGPFPLRAVYLLECHGVEQLRMSSLTGVEKFAALQECVYGPMLPDEHPGQFRLFSAAAEQVAVHRIIRPEGRWTVDEVAEVILDG